MASTTLLNNLTTRKMNNKQTNVNLEVVSENETEVVFRRVLTDEEKQSSDTPPLPTVSMYKMSKERFEHLKTIEAYLVEKINSEKSEGSLHKLKHLVSGLVKT